MLSCLSVFPALAGDGSAAGGARASDVRYTKKVVSVLFDNSGSMTNSDKRNHYAKYALQMLMSLLGEDDTLIITPMTNEIGDVIPNTSYGFEVNLKSGDRNAEIDRVMTTTFLSKTPNGKSTPGESVGIAVDQLTERGLKDRDHLSQSAEDLEHWLVVRYMVFKENAAVIGRSLSFGLVLFCIGLCVTLLYLLISTLI
jgi:hypothetical protein